MSATQMSAALELVAIQSQTLDSYDFYYLNFVTCTKLMVRAENHVYLMS